MTKAANVTMTYVPYAGSAPAVTAAMGQHVTSASPATPWWPRT